MTQIAIDINNYGYGNSSLRSRNGNAEEAEEMSLKMLRIDITIEHSEIDVCSIEHELY